MNDRIKLNILSSGDYLVFHTYSRAHELSHSFYVNRDKFRELERNGFAAVFDHPCVLTIRINARDNTVTFTFAWLNRYSSGELHGREEIVTVPEAPLMEFVRRSEEPDGVKRWAALALPEPRGPRLVFRSRRNLKAVIGNRMLYRKFRKELNQHFHWQGSDEIIIYDDFVPYSFGFTEMRNGRPGICGGIILHNHHILKKSKVPQLAQVRVQFADDACRVSATDMTAWLSADIPAGRDEFSFVFRNTKKLLRVLSHLKGELTVEPFGSENDPQVYLHTSEMAGEFPVLGGYRP